jgi:hypothetical protein
VIAFGIVTGCAFFGLCQILIARLGGVKFMEMRMGLLAREYLGHARGYTWFLGELMICTSARYLFFCSDWLNDLHFLIGSRSATGGRNMAVVMGRGMNRLIGKAVQESVCKSRGARLGLGGGG